MKALTLPANEAWAIARGEQTSIIKPRSLPRALVGHWIVIHAKSDRSVPPMGIGRMQIGESVARFDGDCDWPVLCAQTWDTIEIQRGASGFWAWPGDGMTGACSGNVAL